MTTRHPRLLGLAACLALAVLLIGLPAVLISLGWGTLPAVGGWWEWLTTPDDGRLALLVFKAAGWVVWLALAISTVAEIVAAARGIKARRLPGLGWTQPSAHRLVAAAMLLFVAVPTSSASLLAAAAPAAVAAPTQPITHTATTVRATAEPSAPAATEAKRPTHTVRAGDSLWSIAERYLGSGLRYPEIAALNADLLRDSDDFLTPGWVLTLPEESPAHAEAVTVKRGDTLSGIARTRLGDETHWPTLYEASRHDTQPDGGRLSDPDLILPGWTITVPEAESPSGASESPAAAQSDPAPTAAETTPAATPTPTRAAAAAPASPATTTTATASPAAVAPGPVPITAESQTEPTASESTVDREAGATDQRTPAPWLLAGLAGGGGVLAGGLYEMLRRRRRAQFRARRPGRTISVPPAQLAPVEKTIVVAGAVAAPTLAFLAGALRFLAASVEGPIPDLLAVQQLPGQLLVVLGQPVELPSPWRPADPTPDATRWSLATDAELSATSCRDPYPQLVSIGEAEDGSTWMVNLERWGTVSLTGDSTYAADFARYLAAEIAVSPWCGEVQLDCVGVAAELKTLDPARIRHHELGDCEAAIDAVADEASRISERCSAHSVDAATGRAGDVGDDVWPSWLLLVCGAVQPERLDRLVGILNADPGHTGTTVVLADEPPLQGSTVIRLTGQGRVEVPSLGLDLVAVGLTPQEAFGAALLMAQADQLDDAEIPTDGDEGWREHADAAGSVRSDLVLPRDSDPGTLDAPAETVLPTPDAELLERLPATADDLSELAPLVPTHVRARIEDADAALDAEVAAWLDPDCPRPRLSLLGAIQARVGRGGNVEAPIKRRPFYTEILTYLALHPNGATTDELMDAFNLDARQIRKHLSIVRDWLGKASGSGELYLPLAAESPAGLARGVGVYQLVGVLVDFDLFRRLRVRGEARGSDGLPDLQRALQLVDGEPFLGQRERGWAWLAEGIRHDQHMVCAIVDVAHVVTLAALHAGDIPAARSATEIAILAAPYEDTPQLDMAAVIAREGDRDAAERLINDGVCHRSENGEAPSELPARTAQLVDDRRWLKTGDRVA